MVLPPPWMPAVYCSAVAMAFQLTLIWFFDMLTIARLIAGSVAVALGVGVSLGGIAVASDGRVKALPELSVITFGSPDLGKTMNEKKCRVLGSKLLNVWLPELS